MRVFVCVFMLVVCPVLARAGTFSVECVDNYDPCGGGSLSQDNAECDDFQDILKDAGFKKVWDFRDGEVWGNDFRDGASSGEFSDEASIFYYSGHGFCNGSPDHSSDPGISDRPVVCANTPIGGGNTVKMASESRWGSQSNGQGKARWMLFDASCSMTVEPNNNNGTVKRLAKGWGTVFRGLHLAVGSHGDAGHDILDSEDRGEDFAEDLTDGDTYTDAWMDDGLIDVEDGACAVTMAVGSSVSIATNRRDNETLFHSVSDSGHSFLAYSYSCE